jgi:hypothetical protein
VVCSAQQLHTRPWGQREHAFPRNVPCVRGASPHGSVHTKNRSGHTTGAGGKQQHTGQPRTGISPSHEDTRLSYPLQALTALVAIVLLATAHMIEDHSMFSGP